MKIELQGDWGYWADSGQLFQGYTKRHKVRLFFGINGQQHDGSYCFKVPKWGNQKKMHQFMSLVGNPLLNFVIGYEKML